MCVRVCACVCGFSQAIAAGIGGVALAAILAALCLNYKHFGGGLPDLLLMRAVRIRGGGSGSKDATGDGIPDGTVEPVLVETEVSTVGGTNAGNVFLGGEGSAGVGGWYVLIVMHGRSRITTDPHIPTMPGRGRRVFTDQAGIACL